MDLVFLASMAVMSQMLYRTHLGFYSDDWDFLGLFRNAAHQSVYGFYTALYETQAHVRIRPVQILWLASLYRSFGADPLGYHLANGAVVTGTTLVHYLTLRQLRLPRLLAVSVPLIYALLPHYTTDHFWIAASQANLSMLLFFLSVYGEVKAFDAGGWMLWAWRAVAVGSMAGSLLAYEVTLPLFFLTPLVIHARPYWSGRDPGNSRKRRTAIVSWAASLSTLILVLLFKAAVNERAHLPAGFAAQLGPVLLHAVRTLYGGLGVLLPREALLAVGARPDPGVMVTAAAFFGLAFVYLRRLAAKTPAPLPGPRTCGLMMVFGLGVSGLAFSVLLVHISSAVFLGGINNRVLIAVALGVAWVFSGAIACTAWLLPHGSLRLNWFCAGVAAVGGCGFVVTNTVSSLWRAAYVEQRTILADLQRELPGLPAGSTLLLAGGCPEHDAAVRGSRELFCRIVFESSWDLTGALRLLYGDSTLRGDVIRPNLRAGRTGITTLSHDLEFRYPYGDRLFVFDFRVRRLTLLRDAETAAAYFAAYPPAHSRFRE